MVKRVVICCILVVALSLLWGCGLLNHQKQPSLHVEEMGCAPVDVPVPCSKQEVAEVIPPEPPKPEQNLSMSAKKSKRGELYRSKGRVCYPLLGKQGYEEKGVASWYGPSFHGRKTSSGEVFDMHKISAAHKILPMHAQVTVTNLENGRSMTLTVNDRGPFVAGRVLDLSYAAAKNLDMVDRGLARVLIRTSEPVPGQKHDDITGEFFVHVGSFEAEEVAARLLEDMKSLNYKHSMVKVIRADRDGDIHWRVELGPYRSMSRANKAHSTVVKDYPSAFVVASQ
jgi:rare lipoprotein A